MEFRVISLPPFIAASSGVDKEFNFSNNLTIHSTNNGYMLFEKRKYEK